MIKKRFLDILILSLIIIENVVARYAETVYKSSNLS